MKLINVARDTLIDMINKRPFTQTTRQPGTGYRGDKSQKTTWKKDTRSDDEISRGRPPGDYPDNQYMQDVPWDRDTCLIFVGVVIVGTIIRAIIAAANGEFD
jgi:hypothetical protein